MKIKKYTLILSLLVGCIGYVNAARFTVYNDEKTQNLHVEITDINKNILKSNIIAPGKSITYNTYTLSSFGELRWGKPDDKQTSIALCHYKLDVRSPGSMLSGVVRVRADGYYAKNFNANKVVLKQAIDYGTLELYDVLGNKCAKK